jgi:hypothetical protein
MNPFSRQRRDQDESVHGESVRVLNITTGRLCGKMIKGLRLSCLWQIPPFNRFRAVSEVELPEAGKSKRKRI